MKPTSGGSFKLHLDRWRALIGLNCPRHHSTHCKTQFADGSIMLPSLNCQILTLTKSRVNSQPNKSDMRRKLIWIIFDCKFEHSQSHLKKVSEEKVHLSAPSSLSSILLTVSCPILLLLSFSCVFIIAVLFLLTCQGLQMKEAVASYCIFINTTVPIKRKHSQWEAFSSILETSERLKIEHVWITKTKWRPVRVNTTTFPRVSAAACQQQCAERASSLCGGASHPHARRPKQGWR